MRILLITESCPFPPINGRELPTAMIFKKLVKNHEVDLLIANSNLDKNNITHTCKEMGISDVGYVEKKRIKKRERILSSLFTSKGSLESVNYDSSQFVEQVKNKFYDWVWISPIFCYFILTQSKNDVPKFYHKLALGLNDVKTYFYRDSINEVIKPKIWDTQKLVYYVRSFWMRKGEKAVLNKFDLIHVQTKLEKEKALKVLGKQKDDVSQIIVAPNGKKESLCNLLYNGVDSKKILLMTQMQKGRKNESKWFLKRVWPLIHEQCPEASLHLVGAPPKVIPEFMRSAPNVVVEGFVPNLEKFIEGISISVVPTFHGTGLINRILDSLCASLPTVTTPQAAATFPDIEAGRHLLISEKPNIFANHVVSLLKNRNLRLKYSRDGKTYAENFPDWNFSVAKIENELLNKLQKTDG